MRATTNLITITLVLLILAALAVYLIMQVSDLDKALVMTQTLARFTILLGFVISTLSLGALAWAWFQPTDELEARRMRIRKGFPLIIGATLLLGLASAIVWLI